MKKSSLLVFGLLTTTLSGMAAEPATGKQVFNVETEQSRLLWKGKKVTGEHTGYLSLFGGSVIAENGDIVAANVRMDMNSIVCTDLTNEQWNQKLVNHLKSDDFFSVQNHPESVFSIGRMEPINTGDENLTHMVTGNLTIKGITHEITFPAYVDVKGETLTARGSATIDRTKYNIRYGSGSFFKGLGDNMIYDEFEITIDLKAKLGEAN